MESRRVFAQWERAVRDTEITPSVRRVRGSLFLDPRRAGRASSEVVMTPSVPRRVVALQVAVSLALLAAAACREDRPVGPAIGDPSFAKGGPSGDPVVSSTNPSASPRNVTIDVTVSGSGFDQGSRAVWAIDGDTAFATTKVKTNSTMYVSAKQLVANITIGGDSPVDLYDVQVVTLSGRKGIGIELFAVTALVDLGPASDSSTSQAFDISATGTVVGWTVDSLYYLGPSHATRWSPAGGIWTATDLTPLLGGSRSSGAYGINDAGDIVGSRLLPTGGNTAYVLSAAGVLTDLGSLPGLTQSFAWDISNAGEVVGYAYSPSSASRPFYWSIATGMVALPTLEGSNVGSGVARTMNDNGIIVGESWDPLRSTTQAVRWQNVNGVWTIARIPSNGPASARAINGLGDIVGDDCVGPSPCQQHAVLWPASGPEVDIGTLGGTKSVAYGVNDAGVVVGSAASSATRIIDRAFIWTSAGGIRDLGALGGDRVLAQANAINKSGLITGISTAATSRHVAGQFHGTIWRGQ